MKRLLLAFATLLAVTMAVPEPGLADLTAEQEQEARSRLNGAKRAGVPLDQMFYSNTDKPMSDETKTKFKQHRVIKGKDWNAMSDEQKKTAIDNLKQANPDAFYVDLRTGDVYSIGDDPGFNSAIRSSVWDDVVGALRIPDGILTREEWEKARQLELENRARRNAQPPAKPETDRGESSDG